MVLRPQGVAPVDDRYLNADVMEIQSFGYRAVSAAHDDDLLALEERAVAGAAIADPPSRELGFSRGVEMPVMGPGSKKNGLRLKPPAVGNNLDGAARLDVHDFLSGVDAQILERMGNHDVDQALSAHLGETGIIFHHRVVAICPPSSPFSMTWALSPLLAA